MGRNRMTWAGRKASAPPATPGYGTQDQDHPAHQPDPAYEKYKQGDPDAWAETPKPPPYPQGNPPATPGYDTQDQDHPAHIEMPRVPKEASIRAQVEKKAAKCIHIARSMLGKKATDAQVEDQALDLMDLPDEQIEATLGRMGGGFLADEEEEVAKKDNDEIAEMLADDDPDVPPVEDEKDADDVLAKLAALRAEVETMKRVADQNDPKGKTLAPGAETEEQVKQEALALEKGEAKAAADLFDAYDTDHDGFVMAADWKGDRKVFAALDTDNDGILARHEVVKAYVAPMSDDFIDDMALSPEDQAMLAEIEAEDEPEAEPEKKAEAAPEAKPEEEKKAECKAEDEPKKDTDDSGIFALNGDPMGLGDELPPSEDDALLAEIFGGKNVKKSEDEPKDEPKEKEGVKKSEDEPEEPKEKEGVKKSEDEPEEPEKEEEEKEDDDDKKEASVRVASQRPQTPKPRQGIQRLGSVSKIAGANEIDELSRLWQSDPDVSDVFGK